MRQFQFGPGGKRAIFSTRSPSAPSVLFSFAPDKPEQREEVARVKQELGEFVVLDPDVNQVLIVELLPRENGVISSEDPKRLWWVDREANELRELTGPWEAKSVRLPDNPVSPGGRFIAITSWRPRAGNSRGNYQVIHILDRESKTARTIEIPNQSSDPVGWVGSGGAIRLAFLKNRSWDKNAKEDWYLAEPETGRFAPADKPSIAVGAQARQRSPDGGLIAAIKGNDELTITDANTGESRSFKFHEEDRRFVHEEAFEWMSARYLLLHLGRLAFLDVQSLKMSYPLPLNDEARGHTFSPDFRWVLWQTPDDALYVSPVVLPENGH